MTAAFTRNKTALKISTFRGDEENRQNRKKVKVPAVNINETDDEYILMMAAPGFSKEALQVQIENNILSVAAAKEIENINCIHDLCEYDLNRWKREFVLPDDADGLMTRATYLNGELIIRIPKGKTGSSPYIIPIYVY